MVIMILSFLGGVMENIVGINQLMKHLRNHHNIMISGSLHKRSLRNYGYFHGYKGYRYFKSSTNRIKYTNFDEVIAFNDFDLELKSLFYPHIMFIETAIKNYVLEEILLESLSCSFEFIFKHKITYYKSFKINSDDYRKQLNKRLRLRNQIYSTISRDYSNEKKLIQHYYHNDKTLPIWAIFEIISMGEFGSFVSCLDLNIKKKISRSIDLNQSCDSDKKLTERIIFIIKELRNAIAHNLVIFDVRFKNMNIANSVKTCIELDTKITNITFQTILDYFILIIYLQKKVRVKKSELKRTINHFEMSINNFKQRIPYNIYSKIFLTDTKKKLIQLRDYV